MRNRQPITFRHTVAMIPLLGFVACGEAPPRGPGSSTDGTVVYQVCMGCHGIDGHGVSGGIAPSLVGSDLVLADDTAALIKLLLHGVHNDGTWPGLMIPWRDTLSDEQIAAVLTHIRSQWGNDAPPVTAQDIAEIRDRTSDRTGPYRREELRGP